MNSKDTELESFLRKNNVSVQRIDYRSKKDLPFAIFKILRLFIKNKPDVVHTHLFDATVAGLIAAKIYGIKKRIYTRHHSSYHHVFHPSAVKWDKLNNMLSTHIISISEVVTEILVKKENVPPSKIHRINHGFDLNAFANPSVEAVTALKKKYNPQNKYPVIGVISRFTEWKGVHYIVAAFREYLKKEPSALLLLFNASGDYEKEINKALNNIDESSYKKVNFEKDITALYHIFDIFIHTPIDAHSEAFGQTYIESMAAGVPLIGTKSGIGNEIMKDRENCIIAFHKNSDSIYESILFLQENPEIRKKICSNASLSVKGEFNLESMITKLEEIYVG